MIRTVQALSGLAFGTFMGLHFLTHLSILFGPESFNKSLQIYRFYYQHPIVEMIVLPVSVLVHVICGLITSRQRGGYSNLLDRLFAYSGWFLMIMIGFHTFQERKNSFLYGSKYDNDFDAVSAVFAANGALVSGIYFWLWGSSGIVHMSLGLIRSLGALKIIKQQTSAHIRRNVAFQLFIYGLVVLMGVVAYAFVPGAWYTPNEERVKFFTKVYHEGVEEAVKI